MTMSKNLIQFGKFMTMYVILANQIQMRTTACLKMRSGQLNHVEEAIWNTREELMCFHLPKNVAFPSDLKKLKFNWSFNESLDTVALPSDLQELYFGWEFDKSLDNVALPSGLQELTLGGEFNRSLQNVALPSGLQKLYFGLNFNTSLDNVALPSSLRVMHFGSSFNQALPVLPSGLETLHFGCRFDIKSLENVVLPSSLKILGFDGDLSYLTNSFAKLALPSGLLELRLDSGTEECFENVVFPSGLQKLVLGSSFQIQSLQGLRDKFKLPVGCDVKQARRLGI